MNQAVLRQALDVVPSDDTYVVTRDSTNQAQLVTLTPIVDLQSHATTAMLQLSTPMQPITSAVTRTRVIVAVSVAIALGLAAAVAFPLVSAGHRATSTRYLR